MPKAVQAVAYHRDPLGVLRRIRARLGPVFTLRFPLKDPLVIAAVPEALPALLEADPERAHAGAGRRLILPQASPRSPFGGDEDAHVESRKRMWPAFAPERIETIEPAIRELAEHHVSRWPLGRPFRLLEAMRSLCTDITVRLILGVSEDQRRAAIVAAIRGMLNTPGNPPLPVPGGGDDGAIGRAADRAFAFRTAETRQILTEELQDRRARDGKGNDVLGAMLASDPPLTDDQIVDELLIVLAAAQEPPAIALTNVLYELAGRPAVDERFLSEPGMQRAIVAEAIRLRPSASAALRKLTEPMQIGGHALTAGVVVAAPSLLLHRDPDSFNEPDAFIAERFVDGISDGAPYMPFGGGARRCIGEALAEAEFRTVLPTALGRLQFTRAWPRQERMVVRATVLVPARSALVTASARGDRQPG